MWLIFSILAAITFGMRGVLYHWTSQQSLNRNTLLCGTFFMGAIISLVCSFVLNQEWAATSLVGIQMGLFSFAANASMFKGFKVGKASVVAILTALPAVLVVIGAFFIWGERLNYMQFIAFIIIVSGVLLVRYSNDISIGNLQGSQWGLLALLMFAINDLSGKWSTILNSPMFPTLFLMFLTGTICFGFWWLRDYKVKNKFVNRELAASKENAATELQTKLRVKPVISKINNPWTEKRTFLVGMGVGITNAVGMVFILIAFDYGKAGLVSAVVSLNVFLVLLYTRFFIKEKFTRLELIGILTAIAGILFMRLSGG
ncbi:DMT family transporter [Metabacillus rhizolycopersici]|uniref:DMT family transporter n=1 Tax=Metabacillus rhizolycopersici TaxID=2875709 RepID=A0ABS7UQI1_9BACI|nr:DMT family transporter [Metabacillus rhizolycopersici]MBZ5750560.1 DMT family transporter [Metabacillus rhizolycopersici]